MDSTIETAQPMGHEIQMPVVPSAVRESSSTSATRSTRSVNVATMNCFISPAPRCLLLPEFRALSGCASAHQQPVHAAGHRRPARSASSSARAIRSALPPVSWSGCSWPPGRGNNVGKMRVTKKRPPRFVAAAFSIEGYRSNGNLKSVSRCFPKL